MSIAIMNILTGFKIRRKADVDVFINKCICKGSRYSIVYQKDKQLFIEKDKDGNVSVAIRNGDLYDIFNPSIEVARTKDNCYDKTVQDYIWLFRKVINNKWFND